MSAYLIDTSNQFQLREASCMENFFLNCVPGCSAGNDGKILKLFLDRIKEKFQEKEVMEEGLLQSSQRLLDRYVQKYSCESYKPALAHSQPNHMLALLERYLRAVKASDESLDPTEQAHFYHQANLSALRKWEDKGFDGQIFYKHPDFVEFILVNNLHYVINFHKDSTLFQHSILYNDVFKEPQILVEGSYISWSSLKEKIPINDEGKIEGWFYGEVEGLVPYNINGWTSLADCMPLRVLPQTERPETAQFTIVTAIKQYPQGLLKREHTSFRLTLTTGEVYSFGLWSDPKLEAGGVKTACETGYGQFVCPDSFELMGENVVLETTSFSMNEEQLNRMITTIEKSKQEGVPFHWWERNCSSFVCNLLKILEIELDTTETVFNLLPQWTQETLNCIWSWIPCPIQAILIAIFKVLEIAKNIFTNTIFVIFMGASKGVIQKINVEGEVKDIKRAMISCWSEFFLKNMQAQLPRKLLEFQRKTAEFKGSVTD